MIASITPCRARWLKIKLADFGFSSYLTTVGDDTLDAGISFRGTPGFFAPETYTAAGIGKASDMYCAGAVHACLLGTEEDLFWIYELFQTSIDGKNIIRKGVLLQQFKDNTRDCSPKEWRLLLTQLFEKPNTPGVTGS